MASFFWFIVLIGILIFAHECGHFLFAKLFHVKVLTFSLGFGKPIRVGKFRLAFQKGDTEYRVAWFPAGGFVRMLGDDPTEDVSPEDRARAFSTQAPWKRFLIILGGPLFSILLAIPVYFAFHLVEDRAPAPVVGRVIPGSPAAEAGVLPGDEVVAIGEQRTETWEEIEAGIQDSGGRPIEVSLSRDGKTLDLRMTPREKFDETGLELLGKRWDIGIRHQRQGNYIGVVSPDSPAQRAGLQTGDSILKIGEAPVSGWWEIQRILEDNGTDRLPVTVARAAEIKLGAVSITAPAIRDFVVQPVAAEEAPEGTWHTSTAYTGIEPIALYIMDVSEGQPAAKHGLKPNDKIVSVFGRRIHTWEEFSRAMAEYEEGTVPLAVRQDGKIKQIEFEPAEYVEKNEFNQETKRLVLGVTYPSPRELLKPGRFIERPDRFSYAGKMAFVDTGMAMYMNVIGFVRIFEGRVKATDAIGGPLMIMDVAGKSAKRGWRTFVRMMAFLSVLLGMLNLLPIPILDGGHIAFILIEVIIRRPVSVTARIVASYIGLVLLVGLMVFAFGNDIFNRYWSDITSLFS